MTVSGERVCDVRDDDRPGRDPSGPAANMLSPDPPDPPDPPDTDPDLPGPEVPDPDVSGSDDREVWECLRSGDQEAIRPLFLRYSRAIYNYAFRGSGSWAVADDVVQVIFTLVLRKALAGDLPALRLPSAGPMLFAMARKECSNQLRSARRQAKLAERIRINESSRAGDNTAEWLAAESAMNEIIESLRILPAGQREAVALVRWSGLSLAEAAEALGVPIGTVKSRLNRAQLRLSATPLAGLLRGERE